MPSAFSWMLLASPKAAQTGSNWVTNIQLYLKALIKFQFLRWRHSLCFFYFSSMENSPLSVSLPVLWGAKAIFFLKTFCLFVCFCCGALNQSSPLYFSSFWFILGFLSFLSLGYACSKKQNKSIFMLLYIIMQMHKNTVGESNI